MEEQGELDIYPLQGILIYLKACKYTGICPANFDNTSGLNFRGKRWWKYASLAVIFVSIEAIIFWIWQVGVIKEIPDAEAKNMS